MRGCPAAQGGAAPARPRRRPAPFPRGALQHAGGPGAGLLNAAKSIFYVLALGEHAVSTALRRFVVRLM